MRLLPLPVALMVVALTGSPASAHYNMLLLSSPSVKKGETVTLTYQWGHPFEHQLFDAPAPKSLNVLAPDGTKTDLTKRLEKMAAVSSKEKRTTFQLRFTPEQRGDYVFVLETPPIPHEDKKAGYEDTVTVILHVQAQKGWDQRPPRDPKEWPKHPDLVPLTRPYGLLPGTVFQAQALGDLRYDPGQQKHITEGVLVEIERYNPAPPKELPADEFITRTVKTAPSGVITCTLPEPGWWCLTITDEDFHRATLWVYVDEKAKPGQRDE